MKRSATWIQRQRKDPYVRDAREENYRSRAVYKLKSIDVRDRLFKPGQTVVDLGAAPGSWSQYASDRVGTGGRVIAVDILDMPPIKGVEFLQGDFSTDEIYKRCLSLAGERQVDLVISDLAPNLTGIRDTDQARSMYLAELVSDFAFRVLKAHGDLLIKVFQGSGVDMFRNELNSIFQRVMVRKPEASRDRSREFYVLARGFKI